MTVLLVGNHQSVFPVEITKKLRENKIDVQHVDFVSLLIETKAGYDRTYAELLERTNIHPKLKSLVRLRLIKQMLQQSRADIIHFHYARWFYFWLAPMISRLKTPVAVTVYGSDYYRISPLKRWLQRRFFQVVSEITFTNEATMKALSDAEPALGKKCSVTRFGLTPLEAIDRNRQTPKAQMCEALQLPEFPLTVACGYNANPGQQHLKIIEALQMLPDALKAKTLFLFPMTYSGTEVYKNEVKRTLEKSGLNWAVLEDFLQGSKNAYVRLLPDMMLNLQVSDQLSGSMQEHLYGENVIIAGDWLPYDIFKERGAVFETIASFEELSATLEQVIKALPKYKAYGKNNRKVITGLSSWNQTIGAWLRLYESLQEKKQ